MLRSSQVRQLSSSYVEDQNADSEALGYARLDVYSQRIWASWAMQLSVSNGL
jgi:hypothetical protein